MLKLPYILFESPPIGPVALKALEMAYYPPIYTVDNPKLTTEEQIAIVEHYQPTFILVVGYGAILRQSLLDTVAGQVINIHPSLLPAHRGPAPVVQTILDGGTETGVTIIEIDAKVDHGPILAQAIQPLHGKETPEELYRILTIKGVELFLSVIDDYLTEKLDPIPQNHIEASFTSFVHKSDGLLDFSKPADRLEREIRAYHGWPRSWTVWNDKRLIVDKAHIEDGHLRFERVQPENGKPMTVAAFCSGQRISIPEFYITLGLS